MNTTQHPGTHVYQRTEAGAAARGHSRAKGTASPSSALCLCWGCGGFTLTAAAHTVCTQSTPCPYFLANCKTDIHGWHPYTLFRGWDLGVLLPTRGKDKTEKRGHVCVHILFAGIYRLRKSPQQRRWKVALLLLVLGWTQIPGETQGGKW